MQVKADGVLGLYKGVLSPLVGQMAFRASLFLSYGATKDLVGANPDDPLSYAKVRSRSSHLLSEQATPYRGFGPGSQ